MIRFLLKEERYLESLSDLYNFDLQHTDSGLIVGTDEAGRGPLAGPVVASAVILDYTKPINGLNDSKKLSAKKRDLIFNEILKNAIDWKIKISDVRTIEEINILNASLLAMKKAVLGIKSRWNIILVDGNRYIDGIDVNKQRTIVKGDSKSAAIAAASVLAKVVRDRIMEKYDKKYIEYGFAKHKGYGTKAHIEKIKKIGLSPIHRRSFCESFLIQTELKLGV